MSLSKNKEKFGCVEFLGGEPTIRRDFLDLVAHAKRMGYKDISLATNGRMFSYESFTKAAASAGLSQVTFSLFGNTSKLHDATTRTRGSYDQLISGIKKTVRHLGSDAVEICTVVTKLNVKELKKIGELLASLGVSYWKILALLPEGGAVKFYKNLAPDLCSLSASFDDLMTVSARLRSIVFRDFPLCVFSKKTNKSKKFIKSVRYDERIEGYNPAKAKVEDGKDDYRMRFSACRRCLNTGVCKGIWKEYYKIYGEETINNQICLIQKNG
jgi:MoaA/NifB/PqqE/SkfB family radical SAM enzyme